MQAAGQTSRRLRAGPQEKKRRTIPSPGSARARCELEPDTTEPGSPNVGPGHERPHADHPDNHRRTGAGRTGVTALQSREFQSAPQLRAFLGFVVRATLNNEQEKLKGYTIAVEALGRPEDFNPVTDPIVRVEAARLRRRLEKYYAGSGAADPVRIVIPKGSYAPGVPSDLW